MMHTVIRADASPLIGIGHITRCLTLADMLHAEGVKVSFISRNLPTSMRNVLKKRNYRLYELGTVKNIEIDRIDPKLDANETIAHLCNFSEPIDWLIIDHYLIDMDWEHKIRSFVKHICVIDDLANRKHDCDLLLDQNYVPYLEQRYNDLVPQGCRKLLGPSNVLLRPEFIEAANHALPRNKVQQVLVTFGGSDPTNETSKVLEIIERGDLLGQQFDIVVGNINSNKEELSERCSRLPNVTFYNDVNNMAQLMLKADLTIGAGGTSLWERMILGLPSILIIVADNQRETAYRMEAEGLVRSLGWHHGVTSEDILKAVKELSHNNVLLEQLSSSSMLFMNKAQKVEQHPLVKAILGG